jgi:hypothetical protein
MLNNQSCPNGILFVICAQAGITLLSVTSEADAETRESKMDAAKTTVSLDGTKVFINGQPTYRGTSVEELLFNIRTVNATFDDTLGQVN